MGPLFVKFLLFILGKNVLNQNDIEFDFSIGHVLVLFPFFFLNNKQKLYGGICTSPRTPQNSYISIYFGHKTLFSANLMIIITGTFRNTPKLYEITLFHTGLSAYYLMLSPFTKALSHNYADNA